MKKIASAWVTFLVGVAALLVASTSSAIPIIEEFGVEVLPGGPGAGETGTISIEYEEDFITGVGEEILFGDEFLLSMNLFGQTFDNSNDIEFDLFFPFPQLTFDMGAIVFIDFVINEFDLFNPTDIFDPRIEEIGGGDVVDNVYLVTTFGPAFPPDTPVPAPATLSLLACGLMLRRYFKR